MQNSRCSDIFLKVYLKSESESLFLFPSFIALYFLICSAVGRSSSLPLSLPCLPLPFLNLVLPPASISAKFSKSSALPSLLNKDKKNFLFLGHNKSKMLFCKTFNNYDIDCMQYIPSSNYKT